MFKVTLYKIAILLLCFFPVCYEAAAQDPLAKETPYSIPDAPAYTFLGVAPASISRPTTPRALGTALINGIDAEGQVKQGFALDITPWVFVPALRVSLADYQKKGFNLKYILANSQLSLATTKAASENSTEVAYGVRVVLLDTSDPMRNRNFTQSFWTDAHAKCPAPEQPGQLDMRALCIENELVNFRKQWNNENWNKAALAVASAGGWRYGEGVFRNGKYIGQSVWATGALPVDKFAQLVGQLKYDWFKGTSETPGANRFSYGARLLAGSGSFNVYAEVVGIRNFDSTESTGLQTHHSQWSGGVEFRVMDNIWVATGFGEGYAAFDSPDSSFLIANLRWDLASNPRLK